MRLKYERLGSAQALAASGPLARVTLVPVPDNRPPAVPPSSVAADFLVDTGAKFTVVDREVFDELGVIPSGETEMRGVLGAPERCPVFRVIAQLRVSDGTGGGVVPLLLRAIGLPPSVHRADKPYRGLLGRDFLRTISFFYDGTAGRFELFVDE